MKLFVRAFAISVVVFGTLAASSLSKMPASATQLASRNAGGPPTCDPSKTTCTIFGGGFTANR